MSDNILNFPCNDEDISKLKVGDEVFINGTIATGRDAAHSWLLENSQKELVPFLKNSAIYHCGPVVTNENDKWNFISAGPTTSMREEPYEEDVIKNYKLRAVIGKGGMGEKTLKAFQKHKAVWKSFSGSWSGDPADCQICQRSGV